MARKARRRVVGRRLSVVGSPRRAPLSPPTAYRLPTTGFTLIELLVALALVGTIMTMVYGSYAAASRCLDRYSSRMASSERASLVLGLMARQIRCAYVPAAPSAPTGHTSPSATPSMFRADGTTLSLITTGGPDQSTALARVRYRYDSWSGTLSLGYRPYSYGADTQSDSGDEQPVLRGVRRVDLQFYDGRQWRPTWEGAGLPRAVKIVLTLVDEKSRLHEYGTMVPIVCQEAAPAHESAPAGVAPL